MNNISRFRQMRIIIFYDLPTTTKKSMSENNKFRTFLLKQGFIMIQESIYLRHCLNHDSVNKQILIINKNLPSMGDIRVLKITEKQYEDILVLRGSKTLKEEFITRASFINI